jgi:two-component system, LytTR family, sensor kinase
VEVDVPVSLHGAVLPPLLIQPLIENAIKHGIAPFRRAGLLALRGRLEQPAGSASVLIVAVEDSGPGLRNVASTMRDRPGVGLRNIEDRHARVYGTAGTLRLTSPPGRGTTAELRLPFSLSSPKHLPADARLTHR